MALPILLTACSSVPSDQHQPQAIGMANPASVYCVEQGGKLIPQKDKDGGEFALCQLPNGQTIEEWQLFRQNHPQPQK
ncbi:DUF333 domain-containing protein [Acinetobacter sp. MD2]|uniref:putative hemolysin n=1 Tax=Acinetobacter sp. MD2 TaxID=2600066 RepID=UPI002D7869EF|nr:DUF333 domain-containing protein [Acinetobacter sp. MD2]